ncbi:MAG: hypothetical protein ACTSR8_02965 [Promethearchaeota archaeon]
MKSRGKKHKLNNIEESDLEKKTVDELTNLFMDQINQQNNILIDGIEHLVEGNLSKFEENLKIVIKTTTEVKIKKAFESRLWKKRTVFAKADRLKIFGKINDIKNIGEFMANRLLLYKVLLPDEKFKLRVTSILKSLRLICDKIAKAVKSIGTDLVKAHDICEEIKEERRKMRKEEWALLKRLYNYSMDYLSRTFLYLKNIIEDEMMMADHIKSFAEYIQFIATKYLIFR